MADMAEYYHQISEIQKAVREREIHRLELEKQRLKKTHRREKRYEELRDKIKELHRELIHEELEATHRFQNLLAQVDAVRREHQLLAAHTERLRQKKRQYEMQMAKATPGFQYTVPGGQYQNFLSPDGATTKIIPQAARTKDPSLPGAQPVINPQYQPSLLNSSVSSSFSHFNVQPPGSHSLSEQMNTRIYEKQLLNVAGTPLSAFTGQQGASGFIINPQTSGGTNSTVPLSMTSGAAQFIDPSVQFSHVRNLNPQTNSVLASMGHTQTQAQNTPVMSNESRGYNNMMTNPQHSQTLQSHIPEMQSSGNVAPSTQEVNPQQNMFHPNYLPLQNLHIHHPQLQESQYTESLQKPVSSLQNIQMGTVSNHTYLPDKQGLPFSDATYNLAMTPATSVNNRVPESAKILDQVSLQAGSNVYQINMHSDESSTHMTPSVTRLSEVTGTGSLIKETTVAHPSVTHTTNENAHNETVIKDNVEVSQSQRKHSEQDHLLDTDSIHVRDTVKDNPPDVSNSQPSLHHKNNSHMHNGVDIKQNAEIEESDKNWREVKEHKGSLTNKDTEATVHISSRISSQVDYGDVELAACEDHRTSSESTPSIDDVAESPNQHVAPNNSNGATSNATPATPSKKINPISFSKITSNDITVTSPQAKHVDTNSTASMDHGLKETRVDTLQSPGIHPEETHRPNRKEEMVKSPHQSPISQSGTLAANSPKEMNDQPSNTGSGENDSSKTSSAGSKTPKTSQDQEEDNDSDFFDHDVPVTASAAYKSLVGDTRTSVGASLGTESESDDAEGQISTIMSKQQTQIRSAIKPFASSIPSLRPAPPGTDTDSVDSVEAAIQATLKNKDHSSTSDSKAHIQQPQELPSPKITPSKANLVPSKENIKPGVGDAGRKPRPSAALQLNLESDSESYGVSAGGEASDEDDFDFYDKF